MSYAITGLALLAAATLVNALLTVAVTKRWRAEMAAPAPAAAPQGPPVLAVSEGDRAPAFTLHTARGEVGGSTLAGHPVLICFLRPDCGPTRESLPGIRRWAEENTPSGARLVAVVNGQPTDAGPLLEAVGPLTELTVTEPPNGPVAGAFGVRHHPSFVLLDADGTVTGAGVGQGALPAIDLLTA
ncbi:MULTISPECIES: TlpA family protein disulfide reductase [unclassified Streptomyces]|uniref:TlpA family protein disulfide reductase n=1 Tax=unclassified Streptomyces TaxID=2593676 RepID=UPI00382757CB